jgi:SAM-dependent methyltransferase
VLRDFAMMSAMPHAIDDAQPWNNPLGPRSLAHALGLLKLTADDALLDIGCGRGEPLARALERWPCRGVGIDPDATAIDDAHERLAFAADRVSLQACEMGAADLTPGSFAAAICIGSSHAFGFEDALSACLGGVAKLLRPGGLLVLGEGYWKREPDAAYMEFTGMTPAEMRLEPDTFARFAELGWEAIFSVRSSDQEWDLFEGASCAKAEAAAHAAPDDTAAQELWSRRRHWRDGYLRWGRSTMGFGLYVLRAPAG